MSLYIEEKNQTLLWNLINKNSLLSTIFPNISQKTEWFKTNLSKIYSTLPPIISNEILLNKNKETLTIMINDLKSRMNQSPIYTRNQKEPNSINNQFEERQKEYELMTKKPVIEEVSFKENSKDDVIKNMDELIQQQLREREYDLQNISKTFPSLDKKKALDIKETLSEDVLSVVQVSSTEKEKEKEKEKEQKQVSWGSDSIIEYSCCQCLGKYEELEKKIVELTKKYDYLLEKWLPNLSDFSERNIIRDILSEEIEKIGKEEQKDQK